MKRKVGSSAVSKPVVNLESSSVIHSAAENNTSVIRHKTFLRLSQVKGRVGLSKSSIYARIPQGTFPKQVKLGFGAKASGWIETEIDDWIEQQIERARGEMPNHASH